MMSKKCHCLNQILELAGFKKQCIKSLDPHASSHIFDTTFHRSLPPCNDFGGITRRPLLTNEGFLSFSPVMGPKPLGLAFFDDDYHHHT